MGDSTGSPQGFSDGGNHNNDYTYDQNGNMVIDLNKGISLITYNHLNLPTKIEFGNGDKIYYFYNATGQKVSKEVVITATSETTTTDYQDGYQYTGNILNFFPHAEGYVNVTYCESCQEGSQYIYNYAFNYTDHLGNIRMSYGMDPATNVLKILEQTHYYPFGLKHTNYNSDRKNYDLREANTPLKIKGVPTGVSVPYKYKFGGNEFQDELGLNVYDYDNRVYDQAIGRFWQIDPLAEQGRRWSPYNYCFDNPVYFQDPDGMWPIPSWVKSYAQGAWGTGKNLVVGALTSTYSGVRNGINATKQVASAYQQGGVKAAAKEYVNQVYQTSGAKNLVETTVQAAKGDPKAIGATVVNAVAIAVTHKVAKGSGTTAIAESSTMGELGSAVKAKATDLNSAGRAPATVVGAELNGQTAIATSGTPPTVIAPQLEGVVGELGGVGTKTATGNTVGCCAEFQAGNKLLLENPNATPQQINFTEAIRPRTGQTIPMCENCQTTFGK